MSDAELMQAFFDSTDANIYIKDAEGRFLFVNRKSAEVLGVSQAACVGKTAYDFVPKAQADEMTRIDRQVAEDGVPANRKAIISLPTGDRSQLDHKFPVSIPGQPGAVGGIAIDVTDEA